MKIKYTKIYVKYKDDVNSVEELAFEAHSVITFYKAHLMLVMLLSFIFDLKHVYNFHEQDFGGYPILGKIPRQKMKFSKQERQRNK